MSTTRYDIAVSFAGEQRTYVAAVVEACKNLGLSVFYDKDKGNEWWGRNYVREQRSVYSSQTRFFVPFLSTEYLAKPIPMDEFTAAMMTAVKQGEGYVLPVLMGDVEVPPDLLHPTIHYLHASDYSPEQLARQIARRVGQSKATGAAPENIGEVVGRAMNVRLPKVTPTDWSVYQALDEALNFLVRSFESAGAQLRKTGHVCTVSRGEDRFSVRVERRGELVFALNMRKGGGMGDNRLSWSVGRQLAADNGFNGWATPVFDRQRQQSAIEVFDLADYGQSGPTLTNDEFFDYMWDKLVIALERAN